MASIMSPQEALTIVQAALTRDAAALRREAASRKWTGPWYAEQRASRRAQAAQRDLIRQALTVAGPADFAMYALPLIVNHGGRIPPVENTDI